MDLAAYCSAALHQVGYRLDPGRLTMGSTERGVVLVGVFPDPNADPPSVGGAVFAVDIEHHRIAAYSFGYPGLRDDYLALRDNGFRLQHLVVPAGDNANLMRLKDAFALGHDDLLAIRAGGSLAFAATWTVLEIIRKRLAEIGIASHMQGEPVAHSQVFFPDDWGVVKVPLPELLRERDPARSALPYHWMREFQLPDFQSTPDAL